MKILILNWRDIKHPLAGGAEISLFEHAKYWKKKGASVTWFSARPKGVEKNEEIEGIKFIRFGNHYTVHFWAWVFFMRRSFGLPNVIIDSFHFLPFFSPVYARKSKIIALINEPAKNAWFKNAIFPLSLIGFLLEPLFFIPYRKNVFITGSISIAKELENYGIKQDKINVINHGISIRKSGKQQKEKVLTVIYLSQISKDKGVEDALKAFYLLKKEKKASKLWIVGKPITNSYLLKIKELVKSLGIQKSVVFYGFVSESEKFKLLEKSWVMVHPSVREGWGLNVIEANAVGTPVVGYDVVGLRDSIKHKSTGLLVKANPSSLKDGIIEIINNKKNYNIMSKKARIWAKNFDWNSSGKESFSLIQSALQI